VSKFDSSDKENNTDNESHKEFPCKKFRRTLQDIKSNDHETNKSKKRTCGICNEKEHNARICPAKEKDIAN
jgi:hypothetical protein